MLVFSTFFTLIIYGGLSLLTFVGLLNFFIAFFHSLCRLRRARFYPFLKRTIFYLVLLIFVWIFTETSDNSRFSWFLFYMIILFYLYPFKAIFALAYLPFYVVLGILHIMGQKILYFTSRYYILNSFSGIFSQVDFFWLESLRDVLYPNDNRFRRIYRRITIRLHPMPFEKESYEYFLLFLLGYLGRHLVISFRFLIIFILHTLQQGFLFILGCAWGHAICFLFFYSFFRLTKTLPQKLYHAFWSTGAFIYRQLYYLGTGFVLFEWLEGLNINWVDWDFRGNVDEFEDPDLTYPKFPSFRLIQFLSFLAPFRRSLVQNGLETLYILWRNFLGWRHYLALLAFFFLSLIALLFLTPSLTAAKLFNFKQYFYRKVYFSFMASHWDRGFLKSLGSFFYTLVLLPLFLFFQRWIFVFSSLHLPVFCIGGLFYLSIAFIQSLQILPFFLLLLLKYLVRVLRKLKVIFLILFLFVFFSKSQLNFFYFFALGWAWDMLFSFLDIFSWQRIFIPDLLFDNYVYVQIYTYYWIRDFLEAMGEFHVHLFDRLRRAGRVKRFWEILSASHFFDNWKAWVYFRRFFAFGGASSEIKKWVLEKAFAEWYSPFVFWSFYMRFDKLFAMGCFWAFFGKLIITPIAFYQSLFYYSFWFNETYHNLGVSSYKGVLALGALFSMGLLKLWKSLLSPFLYFLGTLGIFLVQVLFSFLKGFLGFYFKFSWLSFCYNAFQEVFFYYFQVFHWFLGLALAELPFLFSPLGLDPFIRYLRIYFIFGFFFNYINYVLNSFYEWLILIPVPWANYLPSLLTFFVERHEALINPALYHVATLLRVEQFLDTFCLNLQVPRDVHRQAYSYVAKRALRLRFLLWVIPGRRTYMYSWERWALPIYSYFHLLGRIFRFGGETFNFSPWGDPLRWRRTTPNVYYGFIWNSCFFYYVSLGVLFFFIPSFRQVISPPLEQQQMRDADTDMLTGEYMSLRGYNREYAWTRFRDQHVRENEWLFMDPYLAEHWSRLVPITNKENVKYAYYKRVLERQLGFTRSEPQMEKVLEELRNCCFLDEVEEKRVFFAPRFLEFYLNKDYALWRASVHRGGHFFTMFSALTYSLNPWIRSAWERPSGDQYEQLREELREDKEALAEQLAFSEKIFQLQKRVNDIFWEKNIGQWALLTDVFNMRILETVYAPRRTGYKTKMYDRLPNNYEFEKQLDTCHAPWALYAWLIAVPFVLFYKAFTFLGGSHWHWNRHSPGVIHGYLFYFGSVLDHFDVCRSLRLVNGNFFATSKREGGRKGRIMRYYYRSQHPLSIIRQQFYTYRLPFKGINNQERNLFYWRLIYFHWEPLTSSALSEIRFINLFLLYIVLSQAPSILTHRPSFLPHLLKGAHLTKKLLLDRSFQLKRKIKELYLWFWP